MIHETLNHASDELYSSLINDIRGPANTTFWNTNSQGGET